MMIKKNKQKTADTVVSLGSTKKLPKNKQTNKRLPQVLLKEQKTDLKCQKSSNQSEVTDVSKVSDIKRLGGKIWFV